MEKYASEKRNDQKGKLMAIIKLTRGFETIIEDELYDELSQYNWYASGLEGRPARRLRDVDRKLIMMYHQILDVKPWELRSSGYCVDHINNDPLDNRKCNLRIVTISENNSNKFGGRQGISYDSTHKKYKVYIDHPGYKRYNVGTFKHRIEAERALYKAKMELGFADH